MDTPCQKFLKELKLLLTDYRTNNLYINHVVINSGETMENSNIEDRILYPNIIVKEIINIYNRHFPNHNQPISDERCREFLRSLLNYKYKDTLILYCPIDNTLLIDPVITQHGMTYSKEFTDMWLERSNSDPITQKEMSKKPFYYNNILIENIIEALQKYGLI